MSVCLSIRFREKRDFLGHFIRQRSNFFFVTYGCSHPCLLPNYLPNNLPSRHQLPDIKTFVCIFQEHDHDLSMCFHLLYICRFFKHLEKISNNLRNTSISLGKVHYSTLHTRINILSKTYQLIWKISADLDQIN